jgi:hypothetical protein
MLKSTGSIEEKEIKRSPENTFDNGDKSEFEETKIRTRRNSY